MRTPSVCAIILTADRPEMTRQAVECFRAQTYPNKALLVWDTGKELYPEIEDESSQVFWVAPSDPRGTIGQIRNEASGFWTEYQILIHWDSDDYSHPNRIAEQVALLQSSGADVVGYNSMLFWREPCGGVHGCRVCEKIMCECPGEAWLYSCANPHYALGTSLCYWRHVWERKPFEATSIGEDERFLRGLKVAAVSSLTCGNPAVAFGQGGPAMVARIHGQNTSTAYDPRKMEAAREWRRAVEWDKYCQGVFA